MFSASERNLSAVSLILKKRSDVTFKENVPDIRNSKVIDIVRELKDYWKVFL